MIYLYNNMKYKLGNNLYALYWCKGLWRESASVTNIDLHEDGTPL